MLKARIDEKYIMVLTLAALLINSGEYKHNEIIYVPSKVIKCFQLGELQEEIVMRPVQSFSVCLC